MQYNNRGSTYLLSLCCADLWFFIFCLMKPERKTSHSGFGVRDRSSSCMSHEKTPPSLSCGALVGFCGPCRSRCAPLPSVWASYSLCLRSQTQRCVFFKKVATSAQRLFRDDYENLKRRRRFEEKRSGLSLSLCYPGYCSGSLNAPMFISSLLFRASPSVN